MMTTVAPMITPGMLPTPPSMTMVSTPTDCRKLNDSGLTKVRLAAKSTPMAPANEAPTAKAAELEPVGGYAHGRGRELVLAYSGPGPAHLGIVEAVGDNDSHDDDHEGYQVEQDVVELVHGYRTSDERLKNPLKKPYHPFGRDGLCIGVMPWGPLVRLMGLSRLLASWRTISPKPRVMIAR
jgi:hypothetical protein